MPVSDRFIPINDAARFAENTQFSTARGVQYNPETDRMQGPDDTSNNCTVVAIPDPWDDIKEEQDKLLDVIKEFQMKRKAYSGIEETDIRACEWTKVLKLIQSMEKHYEKEKMTGQYGSLRKCLYKVGENGDCFKKWLDLLPDGDYGSVVSGSFKLIVETASQISGVRQCVFDAVADIPETIASAELYIDIYRIHPAYRLKQKTAALFKAIIISLRLIVEFFGQSSLIKIFKTVVKGKAHDKPLVDSIGEVKKMAKKIKEEARTCLHERILNVDESVSNANKSVSRVHDDIGKLSEAFYRFLQSNPIHTVQPSSVRHQRLIETGFVDDAACDDSSSPDNSPGKLVAQGARAQAVKPKTILKAIQSDLVSPVNDVEHCLKLSGTLDDADIDRASFVLKSPEVRTWLEESEHPRSLLINGNSEDSLAHTSPLSLVCAHLTHLFTPAKQAIFVSYFCGQRLDDLYNDNRADATGIMTSLIGQLLMQRKHKKLEFNLSFIGDEDIKRLEEGRLKVLCNVFRELVVQIPENRIVFCVVDGISLYELKDESTDTVDVWRRLNKLQQNKRLKAVFKVLATCPGQAMNLQQEDYMKGGEVMLIPDLVDGDGDGVLKGLEREDL